MQNNIRFILINPSHPGNIGAVARAMKTMEQNELYLVNPKIFPDVNATAMAAGADDILEKAVVTSSLDEALSDVEIVIGTSARLRTLQLPPLNPKQAAELIIEKKQTNKIAILFGRENNGLSNEELEKCNFHLYIPTNPDFSSLNLAAAVQLIAYEIKIVSEKEKTEKEKTIEINRSELATSEEITNFYGHLEETLLKINFLYPNNKQTLMPKIKRIFNRVQLEKSEINILRGILSSIDKKTTLDPR